ncbi:MAG: hypothetical protein ACXVFQ_18450 [Solirubrobacteraceae bacterium]
MIARHRLDRDAPGLNPAARQRRNLPLVAAAAVRGHHCSAVPREDHLPGDGFSDAARGNGAA